MPLVRRTASGMRPRRAKRPIKASHASHPGPIKHVAPPAAGTAAWNSLPVAAGACRGDSLAAGARAERTLTVEAALDENCDPAVGAAGSYRAVSASWSAASIAAHRRRPRRCVRRSRTAKAALRSAASRPRRRGTAQPCEGLRQRCATTTRRRPCCMGREARRTLAMPSLFAEVSACVRTHARAFVKMRMELMCQLSATAYECATKTLPVHCSSESAYAN